MLEKSVLKYESAAVNYVYGQQTFGIMRCRTIVQFTYVLKFLTTCVGVYIKFYSCNLLVSLFDIHCTSFADRSKIEILSSHLKSTEPHAIRIFLPGINILIYYCICLLLIDVKEKKTCYEFFCEKINCIYTARYVLNNMYVLFH